MGAVGPLSGLALGALAAGLLVDYGPDPTRLVFWVLVAAFAIAMLAVVAIPGDGRPRRPLAQLAAPAGRGAGRDQGGVRRRGPEPRGDLGARRPDPLARRLADRRDPRRGSHLSGGLPIFVMAGHQRPGLDLACARSRRGRRRPRRARGADRRGRARPRALAAESSVLFLAGCAVAGLGFGPAFAGVFRALSLRAPADQRAALLSAVFVVSYLAFSVPAIIAGAAVTELGLRTTAEIYGGVLIAIAGLALALSGNLDEPSSRALRRDAIGPAAVAESAGGD